MEYSKDRVVSAKFLESLTFTTDSTDIFLLDRCLSVAWSLPLCVNRCICGTDRKCACVLHMFTFLVRQRAVEANGGPQPEKQTGRGPRRESPRAQGRAGTSCPSLCLGQHQRQLRAPHRSVAIEAVGTPRRKITRENRCLRSGFQQRWIEKGASSFLGDSAHFFLVPIY